MPQLSRFLQNGAVFAESLGDSPNVLTDRGFTVNGDPQVVDTPYGKGMAFETEAAFLDIGPDNFIGTGAFSIAVWININSFGEGPSGRIIDNGKCLLFTSSTNDQLQFRSDGTNAALSATDSLSFNTWLHVVGTRESDGTANVYVNGVLSGSADQDSGTPQVATTNVIIGSDSGGTRDFDGKMQGMLMFPRVLTATEVSNLYNQNTYSYNDNLVSHWDMSEINPQDLAPAGNANNGTGTSIVAADIVNGPAGDKAINFDGSNDWITVSNNSTLNLTTAISVSQWVKTDTLGVLRMSLSKNDNTDGYRMQISALDKIEFAIEKDNTLALASWDTAIVVDRWYFVVATYDNATMSLYIDGDLKDTTSSASGLGATTGNLLIGSHPPGAADWDGQISDVRIYNSALTNLAIRDLYETTKRGLK